MQTSMSTNIHQVPIEDIVRLQTVAASVRMVHCSKVHGPSTKGFYYVLSIDIMDDFELTLFSECVDEPDERIEVHE